jgi:hypothetical protein
VAFSPKELMPRKKKIAETKSPSEEQKPKKNPHAVALGKKGGRKGGLIGGKRRAEKLTAAQLSEAGRKAVQARWARWRAQKAQEKE